MIIQRNSEASLNFLYGLHTQALFDMYHYVTLLQPLNYLHHHHETLCADYCCRRQASKKASISIRPINKHTYNIDDNNAQGQAARKAHKAQHCWPPCKKNSKLKNKHIHVHSAEIEID